MSRSRIAGQLPALLAQCNSRCGGAWDQVSVGVEISFGNGPDTEVAVGHKVWTSIQSGTPGLTAVFELEREGANEHDALGILQCSMMYNP
jgi:hypothetical protein